MTRTEQTYRALYIAAKPTATLVAICLFMPVFSILADCCRGATCDWTYSMGVLAFWGYAVFIMLPVNRVDGSSFLTALAIGLVLCIASIPTTVFAYRAYIGLCEADTVYHDIVYHLYAWILLIPVYAYLPMLLLNRIHQTD